MRLRLPSVALVGAVLVAFTGVAGGVAQASPGPKRHFGPRQDDPVVVARGLNSPRQISITPLGGLLVAEGGAGGDECFPVDAAGDQQCVGPSGAISWVPFPSASRTAKPIRLVTGLLSFAGPGGFQAFGPSGVAADGLTGFYFVQTGIPPVPLPPDVDASGLQKLMRSRGAGSPQTVADLAEFERVNDPDQQGFESAPYAVLALRDEVLVADAGGNDVLRLRNGHLSLFAALPNLQDDGCAGQPNENGTTGCDPVPTGLAVGPDGSIYVAALGGPAGTGRIYVLNRTTGAVIRQINGLSGVNGVAVGPDGTVYVSQLFTQFGSAGPDFTTGQVTRIDTDGTRTDTPVPAPAGLAISGHNLYVSAWTVSPAGGLAGQPDSGGQIWRLRI